MSINEDLQRILQNPDAVHLNMLAGKIAKPSFEQIKHLYAEEFAVLSPPEPTEGQVERVRVSLERIRDFPYVGVQASHAIVSIAKEGLAALHAMRLQDGAKS